MRLLFGVFLLCGALAADAAAQTPAERATLTGWADSVQSIADAPALAAYDGRSRQGSGRTGDLRRALYQVRHADLTDNRGEIELVLTNMHVMTDHSNWAWPYYVMALAFDVMARKEWIETLSDGKQLTEKHSDATWRTLRIALDRDPAFPLARRLLGTLTAAGGDRFLRPDQVVALAREVRQPSPDPDALLAWGRHLRTVQDYGEALKTFDRSAARGGDASVLQLERARTLLALGDSTAATTAYWAGVTQLTAAGRQAYRTDLWWIAEPEALTAFDETPDGAIGSWLHRFWNARDAEAANHPGDRLTEHLRRWVIVYQRYRALSPWTDAFWTHVEMGFDQGGGCQGTDARLYERLWQYPPSLDGDLRFHEPLLDHRGFLYLRHGEPIRILTSGAGFRPRAFRQPGTPDILATGPTGMRLPWSAKMLGAAPLFSDSPPAESWMYWWDGVLRVIHLHGSRALGGYAATTVSVAVPAFLMNRPDVASSLPIAEYYAMARRISANDSSVFGPNGPRGAPIDNPACFKEVMAVADKADRDAGDAINRDSHTPPGFRGQSSVGLTFALGTAAEQSNTVMVTFAIPANALHPSRADDGQLAYAVTVRIVAYDKGADQTLELDTTRRFAVNRPLLGNEYLTGVTEFAVPAGNWQVATRISQADGTVVLQDLHQVQVDAGSGISLSDIVTGRPGTPPWTATDGATFPINYPNGWYSGQTAELFYEVRGVPAGATYRSTVEVRPVEGKGARPIQIQSADRATGAVNYVRKTLGLDQLVPGKYRLVLTVEYGDAKASRERIITIVERK